MAIAVITITGVNIDYYYPKVQIWDKTPIENHKSCGFKNPSVRLMHFEPDHPQEVLLAQFSLYVHKGGLKPDSFHLFEPEISLKWF